MRKVNIAYNDENKYLMMHFFYDDNRDDNYYDDFGIAGQTGLLNQPSQQMQMHTRASESLSFWSDKRDN